VEEFGLCSEVMGSHGRILRGGGLGSELCVQKRSLSTVGRLEWWWRVGGWNAVRMLPNWVNPIKGGGREEPCQRGRNDLEKGEMEADELPTPGFWHRGGDGADL
jgi:hypothetical protein